MHGGSLRQSPKHQETPSEHCCWVWLKEIERTRARARGPRIRSLPCMRLARAPYLLQHMPPLTTLGRAPKAPTLPSCSVLSMPDTGIYEDVPSLPQRRHPKHLPMPHTVSPVPLLCPGGPHMRLFPATWLSPPRSLFLESALTRPLHNALVPLYNSVSLSCGSTGAKPTDMVWWCQCLNLGLGKPCPAAPESFCAFKPPGGQLLVCFPGKHLLHPRQAAWCWGPSHEQGRPRMSAHSPERQTDAKQVITSLMDAAEEKQREPGEGQEGAAATRSLLCPRSQQPRPSGRPQAALQRPGKSCSTPWARD